MAGRQPVPRLGWQLPAIFHHGLIESNSHHCARGLFAVGFGFRHVGDDFRIPRNNNVAMSQQVHNRTSLEFVVRFQLPGVERFREFDRQDGSPAQADWRSSQEPGEWFHSQAEA